jgi:predicted nucleotidyltransferase
VSCGLCDARSRFKELGLNAIFTEMFSLHKYNNELTELCRANHVKELFVFGSAITDRFNEKSDVDLVVEFEALEPFAYADSYFSLKFALEELFQRSVDLLEAKEIRNPYLLKEISSKKRLLYAA